MATDYDEPRHSPQPELTDDRVDQLGVRHIQAHSGVLDMDSNDVVESPELPGADLSALSVEELSTPVVPQRDDEFRCALCFLVHHRRRLGRRSQGREVCRDCA